MNSPYPGYPPSYGKVDKNGKYHRSCLVIDILSLDKMTDVEIAMLEEQLSSCLQTVCRKMNNIEKANVIVPQRFDRLLRDGLRI